MIAHIIAWSVVWTLTVVALALLAAGAMEPAQGRHRRTRTRPTGMDTRPAMPILMEAM